MVTLKALEAAINQVETINDHEFWFEIDNLKVCLRPLRSHEETEVQRYAQVAWETMSEDGDTATYQEFMDRVRLATLGFSIVCIGDMDLHGVEYVETDDQDDHGNPISMPKWEAVRDLISTQWTKALTLQVFAKFGELLERIEIHASKLVKFDPSDLDEEIDRVEKRLKTLKQSREDREEQQGASTTSGLQQAQKAVAKVDQNNRATRNAMRASGEVASGPDVAAATEDVVEPTPERRAPARPQAPPQPPERRAAPEPPPRPQPPQPPQEAPQGRRQAIPDTGAPPERAPVQQPEPQMQQAPEPELDEQGISYPHEGDSFFDPTDPDAAMAAEARRQAQLHASNLRRQREQKMARQRAEELGMPSQADLARQQQQRQRDAGRPNATRLDPRTAGLREAANLHDQVFDAGGGSQQTGRPQRAQPQQPQGRPNAPATLHGKPVFKMPTQTLDKSTRQQREELVREHGDAPPSPVQINPSVGGRQSKFRGPNDQ